MLTGSIRGRWHLGARIGKGGFGEIYIAYDFKTQLHVAIKFEKSGCEKEALRFEIEVLTKMQSSVFVPNFIFSGCNKEYNFLVMDLQGPNLASIRRNHKNRCFSLLTTVKIGIEMIKAIKDIHKAGYIHRDIKPSNFVLRRGTKLVDLIKGRPSNERSTLTCMLDFGLARKYLDKEKRIIKSRGEVGFRGTARYASLNSHIGQDLSRRDDFWSLFYLLVEFLKGELPWSRVKDRKLIFELKKKFTNRNLVKGLPSQFALFLKYIIKLKFPDIPDYKYLISLLKQALHESDCKERDKIMDWEKDVVKHRERLLKNSMDFCSKRNQDFTRISNNLFPLNYKNKKMNKKQKLGIVRKHHFLKFENNQKTYEKTQSDGPLDSNKNVPSLSISYKFSQSKYSKKIGKNLLKGINKIKDTQIPSYRENIWRKKMLELTESVTMKKKKKYDGKKDGGGGKNNLKVKKKQLEKQNKKKRKKDISYDESESLLPTERSNRKQISTEDIKLNKCVIKIPQNNGETFGRVSDNYLSVPKNNKFVYNVLNKSDLLSSETQLNTSKKVGADKKKCDCLIM
ncbi:tau-tubulin kinase 1 [Anaeramoeba flamelloides]|uniref:non-specific serine/threonine protein kinase n=1 Tax=Anaeramoeba flamelloides TaxID=1746091 RepID=A0ABQ8Z183_9EUKA|nr:tau-tubulin kinase 1 [Anaeramoeba flamelloides]